MKIVKCDYCGKEFDLPIGEYNKKLKRKQKYIYCSRECYDKGRLKPRKIIEHNDYISVFYCGDEILIDKDVANKIDINKIYTNKKKTDATAYAYIKGISLHRLITNCPKGMVIDHINHNGLDNRKSNIKICTVMQNNRNRLLNSKNTSGVTGVSWCNKMQKWKVTLQSNGKSLHGGYFSDIEEAKQARKDLEKKYWQ